MNSKVWLIAAVLVVVILRACRCEDDVAKQPGKRSRQRGAGATTINAKIGSNRACNKSPSESSLRKKHATHMNSLNTQRYAHAAWHEIVERELNASATVLTANNESSETCQHHADINCMSLCPWDVTTDTRTDRFPTVLTVTKCRTPNTKCSKTETVCQEVHYNVPVLIRTKCDRRGHWVYRPMYERVTVGCTCALKN